MADLKKTVIRDELTLQDAEGDSLLEILDSAGACDFQLRDSRNNLVRFKVVASYTNFRGESGENLDAFTFVKGVKPDSFFKRYPLALLGIPDLRLNEERLQQEAEDGSKSSGATEVSLSGASQGTAVSLDAQNEFVFFSFYSYQSENANADLYTGYTYHAYVRAKCSAAVVGDLEIYITNNTDAVDLYPATTFDTTSGWNTWTVSNAITLDADDAGGDEIRFKLTKATTTTNNIQVDYVMLLPAVGALA